MTFGIATPEVGRKADVLQRSLWKAAGPPEEYEDVDVKLTGNEKSDPATNDEALSYLRITVKDPDADKVGRRFSSAAVELALSSYPGLFLTTPPGEASAYAVYWPTTIPAELVPMRLVMEDREWEVSSVAPDSASQEEAEGLRPTSAWPTRTWEPSNHNEVVKVPLGTIAGARSGDKGGNANVGFWVRTPDEYRWLSHYLTVERIHALMPEAEGLEIDRYELANLLAINFVIHGLLGEGVSSSTRGDPQAKSLGEFLRSRLVDVPRELVRGV